MATATRDRFLEVDGEVQARVQVLSERFNRSFETLHVEPGLFADDAFFDLFPPLWRFQLEGPAAWEAQLRAISSGPSTVEVLRTVVTAEGFLTEHVETSHGAVIETARRVWLCAVRGGQIVETTCYCNGGWDNELRARHAAEAPMLRPDRRAAVMEDAGDGGPVR